ncbi:MAG: hypothetical protein QXO72_01615, partial [Sulfolobales archaeon]
MLGEKNIKLKNTLEYLKERESSYAKDLRSVVTAFKHPILQTLIYGISYDSEKHSMFYASLISMLEKAVALSEEELKIISTVIDNHIKVEEMMIESTREMLKTVEDDRFKLILSAIHNDELIHHKLLLSIKKAIAEAATTTEEVVWNMVWKDSPYHGTPA